MIEILDGAVYSNDYIVFRDLGSDFVTFFNNDIDVNSITLDVHNLDVHNFDYYNPKNMNHLKLTAWHNKCK